jgi:hypothetical protein
VGYISLLERGTASTVWVTDLVVILLVAAGGVGYSFIGCRARLGGVQIASSLYCGDAVEECPRDPLCAEKRV